MTGCIGFVVLENIEVLEVPTEDFLRPAALRAAFLVEKYWRVGYWVQRKGLVVLREEVRDVHC